MKQDKVEGSSLTWQAVCAHTRLRVRACAGLEKDRISTHPALPGKGSGAAFTFFCVGVFVLSTSLEGLS